MVSGALDEHAAVVALLRAQPDGLATGSYREDYRRANLLARGEVSGVRGAVDPSDGSWYWRCYNPACPNRGKGKYRAWTCAVILRTRQS